MQTLFVSSTFRDMNAERDIIQQRVVPAVNTAAAPYGESIWCKDLRWGVDTTDLSESAANTRVLNVCLGEIDRSRPPFVILLGERYGWIPDRGLIRSQAARRKMQLEDYQISVTAFEIEYGAFCRRFTPLVYFREAVGTVPPECRAEDAEHRAKLNKLKARLRSLCGDQIRTYRVRYGAEGPDPADLQAFADMLQKDICRVLLPRWKEFSRLRPRDREITLQRNYLEERLRQYASVSEDEERIYKALTDAASQPRQTVSPYAGLSLFLNGEGTGKSMLLTRIAQRLRESARNVVLACTAGLTPASTSALEILKTEVYALEEYLRISPMEDEDRDGAAGPAEYRERLEMLIGHLTSNGRRVFILIDGAEKLQPGPDRDSMVCLPSSGAEGVAMLVTARPDFSFPFGTAIDPAVITLRERQMALNGLMKYYGRQLSEQVQFVLTQKARRGGLLYTSMLLKRLIRMSGEDFREINRRGGGMAAINAYQEELIERCPESPDELAYQIMRNIGSAVNPQLTEEVCSLLTLSPFGLRESDLAAILGNRYSALDLAALLHSWDECFLITSDGRISFQIESAAVGYFEHMDEPARYASAIFTHLCSLPEQDDYRSRYLLYYALQAFKFTDAAVYRYISRCAGDETERLLQQAAYALWRGRIFKGEEQLRSWIDTTRVLAERNAVYLPYFLDMWVLLMTAANHYRTDPSYEKIIKAYANAAVALRDGKCAQYADSLDLRIDDTDRVLADYYAARGDMARAAEYRKKEADSQQDPFAVRDAASSAGRGTGASAGQDPDPEEAAAYLSVLTTQLNEYATGLNMNGDKSVLEKADPVRDRLWDLCRSAWVREHLPAEAVLGLATVQQYSLAAAGLRKSDLSAAAEIELVLKQHPEITEDERVQLALAYFYTAESSRLSRAYKGEKIPEDRRRQALVYSRAAQEMYGRALQSSPTRELCLALAAQKMNTARLLEQEGTGASLRQGLQELLDGAGYLQRMQDMPGETVAEPMMGMTLYNRMGILASQIGGEQTRGIMETAFDNSLVYVRRLQDSYRTMAIVAQMLQNQAEILERTGLKKHLEMADLRLQICESILEHVSAREILRQLPFTEQIKLKKWQQEVKAARKQVQKKMRRV